MNSIVILIILVGFIIGFLINFTGVGGGVLLVPVLTIIFKLEISIAVGTASIFATLTKIYATYEHIKLKTISYKSSLIFLYGAIPGVIIVAGLINYVLSRNLTLAETNQIQVTLKKVVIGSIFLSTVLIIVNKYSFFENIKKKINTSHEKILLIISGFLIGLIMGTTGVGGGVLIFPVFYLFTQHKSKNIVGSSIFIALVISGITALLYSKGGQVDYKVAIFLSIGSFLGVPIAGKLLKKVSNKVLEYVIIGIILFSGIVMLFSK